MFRDSYRTVSHKLEKCQDKSHPYIHPVLYLLEINGSGIIIDFDRYLVYAGQRVEHHHVLTGKCHFFLGEDVEILESYIVFLVEETFSLYSCHVQDIKFGHYIFKLYYFLVGYVVLIEYIFTYVIGDPNS